MSHSSEDIQTVQQTRRKTLLFYIILLLCNRFAFQWLIFTLRDQLNANLNTEIIILLHKRNIFLNLEQMFTENK